MHENDERDVDLTIHGSPVEVRVTIDGEEAHVYAFTIHADINRPTLISLRAYAPTWEPVRIKGRLTVDRVATAAAREQRDARACRHHGCDGVMEEVTVFGDPNKRYRMTCAGMHEAMTSA